MICFSAIYSALVHFHYCLGHYHVYCGLAHSRCFPARVDRVLVARICMRQAGRHKTAASIFASFFIPFCG